MRILSIILCLLVGLSFGAPKKTDAQIKEQRTALKKLETDLAKKRKELALLETEEKGVLNTISLLDQNLHPGTFEKRNFGPGGRTPAFPGSGFSG